MDIETKPLLTKEDKQQSDIIDDVINSPVFYLGIIAIGVVGFMATYYGKNRISRNQLRKARQFSEPITKILNDLYSDEEDLGHC